MEEQFVYVYYWESGNHRDNNISLFVSTKSDTDTKIKIQTSEFVEDENTSHTTQQSDNFNCSFLVISFFVISIRDVTSCDSQNPLSIESECHPYHNSFTLIHFFM